MTGGKLLTNGFPIPNLITEKDLAMVVIKISVRRLFLAIGRLRREGVAV